MRARKPRRKINAQILEEAASWFVEFDDDAEPDLATRDAFDEWLRRSPEHVRAFLELLPIWEQGAASRPHREGPAELIALAKTARNVVPLGQSISTASNPEAKSGRPPPGRYHAIAAGIVLGCLGMGTLAWLQFRDPVYSTRIAEQRSLVLEDGSTVELNARSRIRVRFGPGERTIDLMEGQVLFTAARDPARPFVVVSGGTRVRAIGTQFDVYRKKTGTVVTVIEGRVAVVRQGAQLKEPAATVLSAGDQLTLGSKAAAAPQRANLAAATAWTQRRLMFQKTSLAEVVGEFNRYNARQLRIEDPLLEGFLVSGTFSSTDPGSLLRFLRGLPGIRVVETERTVRIASAEDSARQP